MVVIKIWKVWQWRVQKEILTWHHKQIPTSSFFFFSVLLHITHIYISWQAQDKLISFQLGSTQFSLVQDITHCYIFTISFLVPASTSTINSQQTEFYSSFSFSFSSLVSPLSTLLSLQNWNHNNQKPTGILIYSHHIIIIIIIIKVVLFFFFFFFFNGRASNLKSQISSRVRI